MANQELKHCPFCGETKGLSVQSAIPYFVEPENNRFHVLCEHDLGELYCSAAGPTCLTEEEAVLAWNCRVSSWNKLSDGPPKSDAWVATRKIDGESYWIDLPEPFAKARREKGYTVSIAETMPADVLPAGEPPKP